MNEYITNWMNVIDNVKDDHTHEIAWGKAIIDCISLKQYELKENIVYVTQYDIAKNIIRYYWNQTYFFELNQGNSSPVMLNLIKDMIEKYHSNDDSLKPWNEVEQYFLDRPEIYEVGIARFIHVANQNVAHRFNNLKKAKAALYQLDRINKRLEFSLEEIEAIIEYEDVLMKLINYKWTQLLERYNVAPNIAKKIKASSELKIKRSTNEKQKNLLIEFFDNTIIRDFFTGEAIEEEFIEIDHVIPWTFLYSDEIWNMVLVSTKKTQSRNQKAPTKTEIEKLKRRNVVLCEKLQSTNRKEKRDMEFAIENKLVDKFFVDVQ